MAEHKSWQAQWIWSEGLDRTTPIGQHEHVYFRRVFHVPEGTDARLVVDVSADSRYRLFLNGESVSFGPCKGDDHTHYYETVDLSSRLRQGKNVLAAKVVHYAASEPFQPGRGGPVSVWRSACGAFLFDGAVTAPDGTALETLHSNARWLCWHDDAITLVPALRATYATIQEEVDGARLPHGWEQIDYDDAAWKAAVPFYKVDDLLTGQFAPWHLAPRTIPQLFERPRTFVGVKRLEDQALPPEATIHSWTGTTPLTLQAGAQLRIELDAGELMTGFLSLALLHGKGSILRLLCSECYEADPALAGQQEKGVRDDAEHGILLGDTDSYRVAGVGRQEQPEQYEPFWFRTFRFVRLDVEVGDEPLTIQHLAYRETGYPLQVQADFASSDPSLLPLWEISIRTLQRCMHETYEDCPYYEQLQYTMDSRLQMLFTYAISGDDRLARKAIHDFHSSLLPSGMLQSRYPSVYGQVIPGFALYWIFMLHDHYLHFADEALVRRYRPTIDAILGWFDRELTPEGLVGALAPRYWSYVDWVPAWSDTCGSPTASLHGPLTVYSLMYSVALQRAADLYDWTARPDTAAEYRERAGSLNAAIIRQCWSEARGLLRDGPSAELYSQHVQIWAILASVVTGAAAQGLMEQALTEEGIEHVSYVMSFFLFRALSTVGLYERSFTLWDTWRRFVDLHLTTWPESDEKPRSDCHAWGAVPLSEFSTEILGVQPGAPGYSHLVVAPQPGPLRWARGTVITPRGSVQVFWEIDAQQHFSLRVLGPSGVPVTCRMPDGSQVTFPDAASCEASVSLAVH